MKAFVSTTAIVLVLIAVSVSSVASGTIPFWQRDASDPVVTEDHPWGGDDGGGDNGAPAIRPKHLRLLTQTFLVDLYFRYAMGRTTGLYRPAQFRNTRSQQTPTLPTDPGTTTSGSQTGNGSGN